MTAERSPQIRILGTYRVPVSTELYEAVLFERYTSDDDTPELREGAERSARAELESLLLFEVLVENRDGRFSVDHFQQPGSDQAPWEERYLSPDGTTVIATAFEAPDVEPLRILFFLHFVDLKLPLGTTYGQLLIPPAAAMPEHLRFLAPYAPVS